MKKVIFFSYDGFFDPLGQSQIKPYIYYLSKKNYSITLISYEKNSKPINIEKILDNHIKLNFRRGIIGKFLNIIVGIYYLRKISHKIKPDLVHLRGFIPAFIFYLSFLKIKYLYDFRSFAVGEHVDTGNLKEGSITHRIFENVDKKLIQNSSGIIVLEKYAENLLYQTYKVPKVPIKIIRTCTDQSLYKLKNSYKYSVNRKIKFVSLGGAIPPYRSDLMLKVVKSLINLGLNVSIDFINKSDHKHILINARKIGFPENCLNIYSLDHNLISHHLNNFDFGLIFYDSSKWRRVCSPTKLGEFLSAGLPIICLEGVDIVDELNKKYNFILSLSKDAFSKNLIGYSVSQFVKMSFNNKSCQILAKDEFSITIANKMYSEIYKNILFNE